MSFVLIDDGQKSLLVCWARHGYWEKIISVNIKKRKEYGKLQYGKNHKFSHDPQKRTNRKHRVFSEKLDKSERNKRNLNIHITSGKRGLPVFHQYHAKFAIKLLEANLTLTGMLLSGDALIPTYASILDVFQNKDPSEEFELGYTIAPNASPLFQTTMNAYKPFTNVMCHSRSGQLGDHFLNKQWMNLLADDVEGHVFDTMTYWGNNIKDTWVISICEKLQQGLSLVEYASLTIHVI